MTTETIEKQEETILVQEELLTQIEVEAREFFIVKDAIKESTGLNKERKNSIVEMFLKLKVPRAILSAEDGEYIILEKKIKEVDRVDMDSLLLLANKDLKEGQAYLEKEDLKTPWDYAKLAEMGRITAEMVASCSYTEQEEKVTLKKTKRKPKEMKDKETNDIINSSK